MKTHTHTTHSAFLRAAALLSVLAIATEAHAVSRSWAKKAMFFALPVAIAKASKKKQVQKKVRMIMPVAKRVMQKSLPVIGAVFVVTVGVMLVVNPKAVPAMLLTAFIVF